MTPFTEKDVQHRLYGDIDNKLKSIRKEIDQTRKKFYNLKRERLNHLKVALNRIATIAVYALLVLIVVNVLRWLINIKNSKISVAKPAMAETESVAKYTIQVALFKDKKDAEGFSKILDGKGYEAFINLYYLKKGIPMHRVCVGKMDDKAKASVLLEKVRKEKEAADSFLINLK